jgi:tRNA uridine 5-carboxymethylaminomethyl modification enzyme
MKFDLVIIGGGHAGVEAAYVASQKPLEILLVTRHLDLIGQMSCNPAIGGIAKGNIVREIDALGGIMAKAADFSGIQFRMLNKSKGPAVWGNRAQADKGAYRRVIRTHLESRKNICLFQGSAVGLIEKGGAITSVLLDSGIQIESRAVILAAGTFLNGVGHIGLVSFPCGRAGEGPSLLLTESLNSLGVASGRLKTGTSPRIDGRAVDFSKMQEQRGDDDPWPFSFSTYAPVINKASCWITHSTTATHNIIRDNLDKSPLYTGKIKSIGPRYCPSIEDKVVRFGERESHNLFLEPEDLATSEMYLNGLATSLPLNVQEAMVHSVPGLEKAKILRPGYGIEYDYFQPLQLKQNLESKTVSNLFFAGQINGTSGYEEAACQGLVAGINAAELLTGSAPFVLGRETSYTGVLIDDLITKGTEEPYRMFTSRAEYRLTLRQDNVDERLMPAAFKRGYIDQETYDNRRRLWDRKDKAIGRLHQTPFFISEEPGIAEEKKAVKKTTAAEALKRPEISLAQIEAHCGSIETEKDIRIRIEADIKYNGFIIKEKRTIDQARKSEDMKIPEEVNYSAINGLLTESRQKLGKIRPTSIGQASRIPGVTPADITVLMASLAQNIARKVNRNKRSDINVSHETTGSV